MQRVSSNLTLFYKIFLPTFWIVFFGALTLAVLLTDYEYAGTIPRRPFQAGMILFFVSGVLMLYFTLMGLKRVEMDPDFVYVTNYFKTYRYPYHNIDRIELSHFLFFSTASLHLKVSGRFGQRIRFIPSVFRLRDFLEAHPELKRQFPVGGL